MKFSPTEPPKKLEVYRLTVFVGSEITINDCMSIRSRLIQKTLILLYSQTIFNYFLLL